MGNLGAGPGKLWSGSARRTGASAAPSPQVNSPDIQSLLRGPDDISGHEHTRLVFLVAVSVEGQAPFAQATRVAQPAQVHRLRRARFQSIDVAERSPEPHLYLRCLFRYDLRRVPQDAVPRLFLERERDLHESRF